MSPLSGRRVVRMNGAGNEILVLDLRASGLAVSPAEARAIARAPRLKFDQLMVLEDPRSAGTSAFMRIFNADGSQSAACGNGTRCVAFALLREGEGEAVALETQAGRLACRRLAPLRFSVEMGRPRLRDAEIPLSRPAPDTRAIELFWTPPGGGPALRRPAVVNMGNPHAIFFVEDFAPYDLAVAGPALEHDPIFPERANISLAKIVSPERIELRVWERGVGLTLACGSAACAALVAAARRGLTGRRATVVLPGGELEIEWRADDLVVMAGPVELEFETVLEPSVFADLYA
ncbi:diaminopimelate epimerase [Methylocella sp.]|uniref:diaminopimelate epimerase n=1 Tax=Methylocella sp. TaxID=1978226 RepID=UPI0037835D4F